MKSFIWNKNYVTGIQDVDEQHHQLIDIINRLGQLIIDNDVPVEQVKRVVDELVVYATYHFKDEEHMMVSKGIDSRHLTSHVVDHKHFLSEINSLSNHISNDSSQSAKQLFEFLIHWLSYHILGSDQDMARQLECIESGLTPQEAYDKEEREKNQSTGPFLEALTELFEVLSKRNKELLVLNSSLEEKVAKRTKELHILNQHLEKVSLTDVLTKLPNRRHAIQCMVDLWKDSIESDSVFSCIMVDADYFKQINDNYGHDAGDEVLVRLAQTLMGAVRTDDTVCRLGGDEFLIVCPNTEQEGVKKVAMNIFKDVSNLQFIAGAGVWQGSISVGVATKKIDTKCYEELLKMADNGLYDAKRDGRNCIRYSA